MIEQIKEIIKQSLPQTQAEAMKEFIQEYEEQKKEIKRLKKIDEENNELKEKVKSLTKTISDNERLIIQNEDLQKELESRYRDICESQKNMEYEKKIFELGLQLRAETEKIDIVKDMFCVAFKNPVFKETKIKESNGYMNHDNNNALYYSMNPSRPDRDITERSVE